MKILHLCIQGPYNDYWGYQDNLLPKYQRRLGHEVTVITTNQMHKDGMVVHLPVGSYQTDYTLEDGQRIIRLDYCHFAPKKLAQVLRWHRLYPLLQEIKPDFIMVHGLGNLSYWQVMQYQKKCNPNCVIIADNHLDYNIGVFRPGLVSKLFRFIYKMFNKHIAAKHYAKFYGVTPWRVTYMQDVFGVPAEKSDCLLMGADDEKIDYEHRAEIRAAFRAAHGIAPDDFVVVTGGKLEANKNTEKLMQAICALENPKIKLLLFGTPSAEMKTQIETLAQHPAICMLGWIAADRVYDCFLASDLAVFPGQHSVLWEQACACGTPTVVKRYEGMEHVNVNGNAAFLEDVSPEELAAFVRQHTFETQAYQAMLQAAQGDARQAFLYSEIAKKGLECAVP